MQRKKTGPEESGTLKNTDWKHLKSPRHLEEPESHRWESPKTLTFLTTDRQTFMEPGGKERLLPASVPFAYSLWPRACVVRGREWSVYEWNRLPEVFTYFSWLYLLCACVCQVKFREQLQALPWLCSSTMCVLETDLHWKTWLHMLSPLHILVHLPELLGVCICGLLFLDKVQVFKKERIKWLIKHLNQKSMWTHWGLWGSFCLFHSKHAYNLFQPSM